MIRTAGDMGSVPGWGKFSHAVAKKKNKLNHYHIWETIITCCNLKVLIKVNIVITKQCY